MEHLRARLPVPSRQHVLHLKLTQQKNVLPGRTGKMGFPPKGAPPTGINLFAVRQARKGGFRRGVEGGTYGGKTKRSTSPPVADEQPRRKLKEKGDQKKKGKPRKWSPFFSVLRQFAFIRIRLSVDTRQNRNYTDTQPSPILSSHHLRPLIPLNLPGFFRC